MRSLALNFLALCAFSALAQAQTTINLVTDAASYAPRVAPGALATVFGSNLANSTQSATTFPLPKSMAGATVYVNSTAAPLLYVSTTQINFQVPSSIAAGTASLYVTLDGGNSATYQVTVVPSAPGIFQDTSNHAIAQNLVNQSYSTNSASNPVPTGAVLVVYFSGIGAVNHPVTDGTAAPVSPIAATTATATATIGGVSATVDFAGLAAGFAGLAQADIVVPASLGTGDYPLVLTIGGYLSSSAMVSVSGSGSAPPTYLKLTSQLGFLNAGSSSVQIDGNTTYVCGPYNISIIDTSDVAMPAYDGEFGDAELTIDGVGYGGKCALNTATTEPILVDIVGPASAPSFAVYELDEPTDPQLLTEQALSYDYLSDLSFIGTTGFASTSLLQTSGNSITAQDGNFVAYDFSTLFPILLSVLQSGPGSSGLNLMPNALGLQPGNYPDTAYITSTTATGSSASGQAALDVVNVSSPSAMQGIETVLVSDAAIFTGFGYDVDLLLVTGNTAGYSNLGTSYFNIDGYLTLSTMNISNVDAPAGIANITTQIPTSGTYIVQPFGPVVPNVFAIINNPPASDPGGPSSLWIVDASNASSPVLYPFATQFGMSDIAAAILETSSGGYIGYLLVPNSNGLAIYTIQSP
jgi:uncharacterized protein (TIGR03437 family)